MESLTSYLRSLASSLASAEANCGPLSDIRVLWRPNHLKMFSKKSFPTLATSMVFEQGIMTTPFIRPWSTMTMMESWPFTRGKSVTRSTKSCLKGSEEVDRIGFNGRQTGWVFVLFCWHTAQPLMNLFMYVDNPGHQKSRSRNVLVWNCPVWPRVVELCKEVTRVCRAMGGMYICPW